MVVGAEGWHRVGRGWGLGGVGTGLGWHRVGRGWGALG